MTTIKPFEVNCFSEDTYLLYDNTKEAVLIGRSCLRKEEQEEVSDFITRNGLTLKRYLCTHLHLGHIFDDELVHNAYGLSPEAHKADVEGLPSPEEQAETLGLPMKAKGVPVRKHLADGEIIRPGKSELAVLSIPGHSPRGMAFYNKENGFVIVGDSLFVGSIGRTDLWGGNQNILLAAIKDKLLSSSDGAVVYPDHNPEAQIIDEKLNNPYL